MSLPSFVGFVCVHVLHTVRSLNLMHKYDESSASLPNFSSLKQKLERKYYSYSAGTTTISTVRSSTTVGVGVDVIDR